MQNVSASDLISVLNSYNATLNGGQKFSFGPQADNQTSFGNYSERGVLGKVATVVRKSSEFNPFVLIFMVTPSL